MFEAAIPQNDNDLAAEKGLSCDIRNRFVNAPQFGSITEAATPGQEAQFSARLSF